MKIAFHSYKIKSMEEASCSGILGAGERKCKEVSTTFAPAPSIY